MGLAGWSCVDLCHRNTDETPEQTWAFWLPLVLL